MQSSEIDLSEFQEADRDEGAGNGDGNDSNGNARDADGQAGNTTAQQAAGTDGEVSLTNFTLKSSILITKLNYATVQLSCRKPSRWSSTPGEETYYK